MLIILCQAVGAAGGVDMGVFTSSALIDSPPDELMPLIMPLGSRLGPASLGLGPPSRLDLLTWPSSQTSPSWTGEKVNKR